MLIFIFLAIVLLLILGGAIFIAKAGISFCEDSRMLKVLLGGYFSLYLLAALLIKVVVPPVTGTGVDAGTIAQPVTQAFGDLDLNFSPSWIAKTAFGAQN